MQQFSRFHLICSHIAYTILICHEMVKLLMTVAYLGSKILTKRTNSSHSTIEYGRISFTSKRAIWSLIVDALGL